MNSFAQGDLEKKKKSTGYAVGKAPLGLSAKTDV